MRGAGFYKGCALAVGAALIVTYVLLAALATLCLAAALLSPHERGHALSLGGELIVAMAVVYGMGRALGAVVARRDRREGSGGSAGGGSGE